MTDVKGYYSLIQYCPDPSRAEAANIGVVLFCPDIPFLEAQVSQGNDRIRRFFGAKSFDADIVGQAKNAIVHRIKHEGRRLVSVDDLVHLIETRANEVVLTQPRTMRVSDPRRDLRQLYAELVGGRKKRAPQTPLLPQLDSFMRGAAAHSHGRVLLDQTVEIPRMGRTLSVPYAFRNGALHLVKPETFGDSEKRAVNRAAILAVEGDLLQREEAGETRKLVVVSADRPGGIANKRAERHVRALFEQYRVRFFSGGELKKLEQLVAESLH